MQRSSSTIENTGGGLRRGSSSARSNSITDNIGGNLWRKTDSGGARLKSLLARKKELLDSKPTPTQVLLAPILLQGGFNIDVDDLDASFANLDSLEMVAILDALGTKLNMCLSPTLLLDFPSVRSVVDHLDQKRGVARWEEAFQKLQDSLNKEEQHDEDVDNKEGKNKQVDFESLTEQSVLEMQKLCNDVYAQEHYQNYFEQVAKECYPDMSTYIRTIEPVLVHVEGTIFFDYNLVTDTSNESVQQARLLMWRVVRKYWKTSQMIREFALKLIALTKQDQCWGSI